ncbi:E3 ubiquitin-protein ligase RGLG2-like isoform X2 [Castanea sativa]|uniref:E3 ubiquitin-protein ligase RGLG2-like isoform X2 n=1 Tax=Castanea sativa TaxID=21020 RepID=UPI003F653766
MGWIILYQSPFDQESQNFVPPQQSYTQQYYAPAQDYGSQNYGVGAEDFDHRRRLNRRYSRIANNFNSLEQVTEALARAGLESSNLIVGIDFTKRNEWTGAKSFRKRSLHHIGGGLNPYEQAISIIGKTLSAFDEDNLIPCFGFGDGPTSFAPVIEMAMTIVEQSGGQYHVLVIIVDGQVQHCVLTSKRKDQAFERQFQLP